ncbi:glutaconate CoA-transferase subunit A [Thalassobacillus cyri]|uniref:Glutaconate CoA-transferase subunit A n=1 Tax=Thalassobacillus cyri TaxID=571932 RepID=A0A1H3ZF37_9BACI|nr:CoA-transferase [Thalassobacillus cyri]SEA21994.1 glutaconate CoA-transferase subunit A [Thalassobacillus cyri]
MKEKLETLEQAIKNHINDGDSVVMGACLEPMIPFAAAYEILRQKKKSLNVIAPISDILFDMLIGAGAVKKVTAAWAGNVSAGLGHNYRRAVEKGDPFPIEIEDHSNFSIGLALLGGAMGAPFLPTKSLLGTGIVESNPNLKQEVYNGEKLIYVPSINPDVAILGVQRADKNGNAHLWGNLGIAQDAAMAGKKVILLAEEIVETSDVDSDPNRVLVPGFKVTSVVECPGFAHPSPVQGYYQRDHEFFHTYHKETKTVDGFKHWLDQYVLSVSSHEEYLKQVGKERLDSLRIKQIKLAAPVNYAAD